MASSRMVFDGRRQPGKSNFVQTCNLLSRYVKERGSLRDLNIEIGGKVESLETIVKPGSTHPASASSSSMNNSLTDKGNLAQPHSTMEQLLSMPTSNEGPKPSSQLTIFYSGRVLTFDDYPAEKVQGLIAFAKKESSHMSCGMFSRSSTSTVEPSTASTSRDMLPPRPQPSTSSHHKVAAISSIPCKEKATAAEVSTHAEANGSDLPIARRSSLHRFLEKRKDRAAARGPYHQAQEQAGSSKGDEQLELRL